MTTVVNRLRSPFDVYIGRGSPYGNPFTHLKTPTLASHRVETRKKAIESYQKWILTSPETMALLPPLRGKVLGCYCTPQRCHGDVIVELLNMYSDDELLNWTAIQPCDTINPSLFD